MKTNYILIAIFNFILLSAFAQIDSIPNIKKPQPSDTSKVILGRRTVLIITEPKKEMDSIEIKEFAAINDSLAKTWYPIEDNSWTMVGLFNLGANGYLYNNKTSLPTQYQQMELDYSRSQSIGFDFMLRGIDLFKKRMYISPGIGIDWNKYHFKDKQQSISTQNDTLLFISDSSITYDKYKLRTTYLQIPLLVGFRLGNLDKKVVNIQFGAIAGYKIGSLTKYKYFIDGTKFKNKVRDDYNVNPFKLDAVARISFGEVGLFGRYSFTSLFEESKAPAVTPFSVGLTFGSL